MDRQHSASPVFSTPDHTKPCSHCQKTRTTQEFFRRAKVWRTCNECSAKVTARRKKQTYDATTAYYHQLAVNWCGSQMRPDQLQAADQLLRLQQQYAGRQHMQQVVQQMQLSTFEDDTGIYTILPLRVPLSYEDPRPDSFAETVQTHPLQNMTDFFTEAMHLGDAVSDIQTPYEPDFSAKVHQSDFWYNYSWSDLHFDSSYELDPQFELPEGYALDFDQCMADALANGEFAFQDNNVPYDLNTMFNLADSMLLEPLSGSETGSHSFTEAPDTSTEMDYSMDVDMTDSDIRALQEYNPDTFMVPPEGQIEDSVKLTRRPRQKRVSVDLDAYFGICDASSENIMQQPPFPEHDLIGEALAKHLIREVCLAMQLLELHGQLLKIRNPNKFIRRVEDMVRAEHCGLITPWGPLSDWFAIYEAQYEDLLERFGLGSPIPSINKLEWKVKYKFKAQRMVLMKSLKQELVREGKRLIHDNVKTLLEVLVDLTGQNDVHLVTVALKKKLRELKVPGHTKLI